MNSDIAELAKIFLIPGSILVGALGVAKTEGLKTGVSTLGLLTALFWIICNIDAYREMHEVSLRQIILAWLPVLFFICWIVAGIIHFRKWRGQANQEVSE